MANTTVNYMYGYSGEDWSKYTDTLTTDSVTISPEKPLKITGEIYIDVDSVNSSRNKFTYSDVSPEELAKEEERRTVYSRPVYPIREDVPAELWGKPVVEKQAVRELVRRETVEYYTEGNMIRRVTKTEQWFPEGEGEFAGPDKPLTSTHYEYIGGRK